jgi:hypothetical protein
MTGFLDVTSVQVPYEHTVLVQDHLRAAGREGLEGIALWAGERAGTTFRVRHTLVPRQQGTRSAQGLSVAVGPEELHRVNVWLYENRLQLIAQVHSHPTEAYHSDTDDAYPIATTIGCLSLVVPDFARGPFLLTECAVYRLGADGRWGRLSAGQVLALVSVVC